MPNTTITISRRAARWFVDLLADVDFDQPETPEEHAAACTALMEALDAGQGDAGDEDGDSVPVTINITGGAI